MLKLDDEIFATGRARFADRDPTSREPTAKIFVSVRFPGVQGDSLAQLDTGAAWSVLELQTAEILGVLDGDGQRITMKTHAGSFSGRLERISLVLIADEGDSLEFEATFLVSPYWPGKTFLGYSGLLNKIRIALDPSRNYFYFGEIE